MATVANNDLTRGLRGRIGKWLVFRMVRGKTIASRAPRKPDPRKQSAAQRLTRSTFREASAWAVRILLDPAKKQYYADLAKDQHLPNAYTAAVREYMRGAAAKRMEAEHHYSIPTNMETNIDGQKRHDEPKILAAQEFIEKNPCVWIAINDICEKVGLSRRTFERNFRRCTGNTVAEYIQRVKVEHAKKELESSSKTINEIIFSTGYNDVDAFRKVFKKYTHLTPVEYRRRYTSDRELPLVKMRQGEGE